MKATIETIAKQCGVSKATVSYVLNNKKSSLGLSPQTIEKVLKDGSVLMSGLTYSDVDVLLSHYDTILRFIDADKKDM